MNIPEAVSTHENVANSSDVFYIDDMFCFDESHIGSTQSLGSVCANDGNSDNGSGILLNGGSEGHMSDEKYLHEYDTVVQSEHPSLPESAFTLIKTRDIAPREVNISTLGDVIDRQYYFCRQDGYDDRCVSNDISSCSPQNLPIVLGNGTFGTVYLGHMYCNKPDHHKEEQAGGTMSTSSFNHVALKVVRLGSSVKKGGYGDTDYTRSNKPTAVINNSICPGITDPSEGANDKIVLDQYRNEIESMLYLQSTWELMKNTEAEKETLGTCSSVNYNKCDYPCVRLLDFGIIMTSTGTITSYSVLVLEIMRSGSLYDIHCRMKRTPAALKSLQEDDSVPPHTLHTSENNFTFYCGPFSGNSSSMRSAMVRRHLKGLLQSLAFLHHCGVVHGDIKGHHAFLVSPCGQGGNKEWDSSDCGGCDVKLGDFGASLRIDLYQVSPEDGFGGYVCYGARVGSVLYMAPEQAASMSHPIRIPTSSASSLTWSHHAQIMKARDIWSLGITAFQLFMGGTLPWYPMELAFPALLLKPALVEDGMKIMDDIVLCETAVEESEVHNKVSVTEKCFIDREHHRARQCESSKGYPSLWKELLEENREPYSSPSSDIMTESRELPSSISNNTHRKTSPVCMNSFYSFIDCCLQMDPRDRPTAEDLLKHPFFVMS
eukprot:Tbor_TRINITY_DN6138_c0_g1::TRINITY_DN6138_c0_g1_i1::g.21654::m.21654